MFNRAFELVVNDGPSSFWAEVGEPKGWRCVKADITLQWMYECTAEMANARLSSEQAKLVVKQDLPEDILIQLHEYWVSQQGRIQNNHSDRQEAYSDSLAAETSVHGEASAEVEDVSFTIKHPSDVHNDQLLQERGQSEPQHQSVRIDDSIKPQPAPAESLPQDVEPDGRQFVEPNVAAAEVSPPMAKPSQEAQASVATIDPVVIEKAPVVAHVPATEGSQAAGTTAKASAPASVQSVATEGAGDASHSLVKEEGLSPATLLERWIKISVERANRFTVSKVVPTCSFCAEQAVFVSETESPAGFLVFSCVEHLEASPRPYVADPEWQPNWQRIDV